MRTLEVHPQTARADARPTDSVAPVPKARPLAPPPGAVTATMEEAWAALNEAIRTETLMKRLVARIRVQAKVQPHATVAQLAVRIGQLDQLQRLALGLRQHSGLAEPVAASNLHTDKRAEDIAWLSELAQRGIAPTLVDAVIAGTLAAEKHLPLVEAAQSFAQELTRLNAACR